MSKKDKGFEARMQELEAQLATDGEALSATLQQLSVEAQPRTQLGYVVEDLKYRAEKVTYEVLTTIDEAREGDPQARQEVVKAAAIGVAVVALCLLRRKLKRRRHR